MQISQKVCRKMKKAGIQVITEPAWVKFDCPHCKSEVEMDYDEFLSLMIEDYLGDWEGETLWCPYCYEEIEVEDVDWD